MNYERLCKEDFPRLVELEQRYKASIGEPALNDKQIESLRNAVEANKIEFYIARESENLAAMCSVSVVFSTFSCCPSGIFEDFFIAEEYRHKGVARGLTGHVFDVLKSRNISSLWVGCADVDLLMYKSLGFTIPLGNLLTWSAGE